jgi:ribosomal protein S18 acetylase RimI-like enzyme
VSIKKITLNELDFLTELFDMYRVFYKQKSDLKAAREFLKERIINKESVIYMAFDEGNPVGFVQLYPSFSSVSMKKTWVLNDLFVNGSVRGKGYGEKLVREAIRFAEGTGAKGVSLETGEENVTAQRLYEKIGFKRESNYFYYFSVQ